MALTVLRVVVLRVEFWSRELGVELLQAPHRSDQIGGRDIGLLAKAETDIVSSGIAEMLTRFSQRQEGDHSNAWVPNDPSGHTSTVRSACLGNADTQRCRLTV